jgi:hypothetical protein
MSSRTAEEGLSRLTASLGAQEGADQREAMRAACPDRLIADIVEDSRRGAAATRSETAMVRVASAGTVVDGETQQRRGSGWYEPRSTDGWRAPGIDIVDQLCDAQDRVDKAELVRKLREAREVDRSK